MMSGGQLRGFRKGWALVLGVFGAAHFFSRDGLGDAVAACRSDYAVPPRFLYGLGTWDRVCKRCSAKHGFPTLADRRQGALSSPCSMAAAQDEVSGRRATVVILDDLA